MSHKVVSPSGANLPVQIYTGRAGSVFHRQGPNGRTKFLMNTQVHLNHTLISILTFPRDRYWIFASSILQLLYQEAALYRADGGSDAESSDEALNNEENYPDAHSRTRRATPLAASGAFQRLAASAGCLPPSGSQTSPIDNSLKHTSLDQVVAADSDDESSSAASLEDDRDASHIFFHIAFTPLECTVMCSVRVLAALFGEPLALCAQLNDARVEVLPDEYITLQVDSSDGYDNSTKVLLLTKPLSLNRIPLFFLSTHFGDIVLIPKSSQDKVVGILTQRNFKFSSLSNSYVKVDRPEDLAASTSPTLDVEQQTFTLFHRAHIVPVIDTKCKLLLTGARSGEVAATLAKVATALAATKAESPEFPNYFAITRTSLNEVSLLLPKSASVRARLGFPSRSIIGLTQDLIIPIIISLEALPLDSTGIVAGLASKLLSGSQRKAHGPLEMSYLSMAKSGIVMVPLEDIALVSQILSDDAAHLAQALADDFQLE